ncbi:MAG: heme lyase CcmF/NrfE family subunit [Pseudomonadota bacterium]
MFSEIGHFALALALMVALVQSILPILGASRGDALLMRSAATTSVVQAGLISLAFAALVQAFVTSDFSILNVVQNSHSAKPMIFKISASWGSHEGSLLLWVLILAIFGAAVSLFGGNLPDGLKARTLSVQAWITVGFLSFMLFTSHPFERVEQIPVDGTDLNPLLQDIGLALHPPLLYVGYVGFSIVFSFAVAALIEGRVDPAWARWVRPWTLAAWVSLTGGIALGSWWAYYELGWGGWWFWDPVENVSFMPWLLGTALLHSAIVTEKRDTFKSWTILLAILTFSLSLFGTFIVRSGLLTSVHAFAVDPERGMYILGLLAVSICGALGLFAWRAPQMEPGGIFAPISRETGLMVNNLLLATATATVLLGTIYPLLLEAVNGEKISVGPPYYAATFVPLMIPLVLAMGLGPHLSWKRADLKGALQRVRWSIGISLAVVVAILWWDYRGPVMAAVGIGLAVWLLLGTLADFANRIRLWDMPRQVLDRTARLPRSVIGMTLAHTGLAVAILGFTGSSLWKTEDVRFVQAGDVVTLQGYDVTFEGVREYQGPNFVARQGLLRVENDGEVLETLTPERRFYPVAQTSTTESAIRQTLVGDLYASIVEPQGETAEGVWTLRLLYEPLINCIWIGSVMLVLGGLISLSDRRLRVGAPKRPQAAAVPAE